MTYFLHSFLFLPIFSYLLLPFLGPSSHAQPATNFNSISSFSITPDNAISVLFWFTFIMVAELHWASLVSRKLQVSPISIQPLLRKHLHTRGKKMDDMDSFPLVDPQNPYPNTHTPYYPLRYFTVPSRSIHNPSHRSDSSVKAKKSKFLSLAHAKCLCTQSMIQG